MRIVRPALAALPPTPSHLDRAAFGLPPRDRDRAGRVQPGLILRAQEPARRHRCLPRRFGTRPDRLLLLKVGNPTHFPDDFATLRAAAAGAPNIRIETRLLPPDDHAALMNAADIVLTLHRSEGLGLVAAEAMLLGKPVVATGWSGNLDFMDDAAAALVLVRLVPPKDRAACWRSRAPYGPTRTSPWPPRICAAWPTTRPPASHSARAAARWRSPASASARWPARCAPSA